MKIIVLSKGMDAASLTFSQGRRSLAKLPHRFQQRNQTMNVTKVPRMPMEQRKELIGALLDRFLPKILPRSTKPAGTP